MEKKITPEATVNSVSQEDFIRATAEWNGARIANDQLLGQIILPKHFDIPIADLIEILKEVQGNGSTDIRAYIGTVPYGEWNGHLDTAEMRLYLTGLENGQPILSNNGKSAIFDFILPCPPTC
ncbi:MAG: hypothetical protein P8P74_02405 [Crocinitomicaceae bacterium]|nr:hypothetical protein [Crocinitomicaceae bacterium]